MAGVRRWTREHPLACYVVLAYLFAWAWWVPLAVSGARVMPGQGWPTHLPGLLAPAVAAAVVTALTRGREGLADLWARVTRWRVGGRWYLPLVAVLAVAAVAFALEFAAGGRWTGAEMAAYTGAPAWSLPLVFLLVLVVNGFGEETGWRGFLADGLLRRHGLVPTSLAVALVWGLWHLPLFFLVESFRDMGVTVVGWAIGLTCGSVVLTWMYRGAGRSIFVVALWHTTYNFTSATPAASGVVAAVTSTAVMVAAVVIVALELRARPRSPAAASKVRGAVRG